MSNNINQFALYILIFITSLVFGLSYGSDNQNTYLIHGLTQIYPDFLSVDWFAHNTKHYHEKFSNIIVFVNYLNLPIDLSLAIIDVILRVIALIGVYQIIILLTKNHTLSSFIIVLTLIVLEKTNSVAGTYIFTSMLQPSSFGSAFSIVGILFFLRGKFFISGVFIALAGYMHTNFLLLGFVYLGIAHLFIGTERIIKRCVIQFLPMFVILAMELPFLLSMLSAENGKMATYIFQFIRSPHHYVPSNYLFDFVLFIGWSIVGVASILFIDFETELKKRLFGLYASLLAIIVISTILTTVVFVPFISKLFFWRMAPFSVLLSQIIFSIAVINLGVHSKAEITTRFLGKCFLLLVGFLFILRWYSYTHGMFSTEMFLIMIVFLIPSFLILRYRLFSKVDSLIFRKNTILIYCILTFSLIFVYQFSHSFYQSSTLFNSFPEESESELYLWVKTTDKTDKFLIPPDMNNFRLHGERAIIVDWKSTPVDPDGLMEWYERMQAITGLDDISSFTEAKEAYLNMNMERLLFLKKQYNVHYAVIYNNKNKLNIKLTEVFKNEKYTVLSLDEL
ncbi:hypothetical protein Q4493_04265 [Colwellia sp. 1_MG-2023]|uniref:DUF6798 domain-containing protein n=1 Tax=Colwellia sp. 1_MG-2023 TaxID=3062649 RepID=UPI0026E1675C|nr:DUF6798 domain-containing protein [Colwellia sp. 1_MG-2023]MDO6444984.1 hypothetical protein [Colwellia sp. 1_MG-2023]